ncbi:hypothetical protein FRUB_03232 [Fimbriiglobus ruber]|uniref:Uncharacterized protein n=1 Tax=Fimbriiglobus ruber TaxID=1908690 RepID=A0A225DRB5_9BACT|nr:hypothetical protein FRUB_03232 [Fimbriiglobus ruber]
MWYVCERYHQTDETTATFFAAGFDRFGGRERGSVAAAAVSCRPAVVASAAEARKARRVCRVMVVVGGVGMSEEGHRMYPSRTHMLNEQTRFRFFVW